MRTDVEILTDVVISVGGACNLFVGAKLDNRTREQIKATLSNILYSAELHEDPSWRGDIDIIVQSEYSKLRVTFWAKNEAAQKVLEAVYNSIDVSYTRGPHGNDN